MPRALVALLLAAAAVLFGQQSETVAVPEGAALRLLPEASSPALTLIDETVELPLLERRGDWARVAYADWKGWVFLADGDVASERPAPLSEIDAKRLARATSSLVSPRRLRLGRFHLVTDVSDEALLTRLGLVAAGLPAVYAERYGLDPGVEADQHVVLFAREENYAAFELETTALRGYASKANGGGVAVVVAGDRRSEQVIELLVHELAHLLNRRALSPDPGALPPWLEEGIAAELSYSRVSAGGRLEPGTLRMAPVRRRLRYQPAITVPVVTPDSPQKLTNNLADLVWERKALPLAELGLLPWAEFVREGTRKPAYAQSANLVRYLLAGRRGAYADRFRSFLREVAEGMPAEIEALWSRLQVSPEAFEREFQAWLVGQRIPPRP